MRDLIVFWRMICDMVQGTVRPSSPADPLQPDRAQLFEQLRALRERREGDAAILQRDVETLTNELILVQTQADGLRQTLAQKQHAQLCASLQASVEEDRLRAAIAGKISTSLQLFIEELDGELEHLNRKEPTEIPGVRRDYLALKKIRTVQTDGPSIQRRARALHAARQRAQAMQFEPLTVEAMNAEILRLRRTVPEVVSEEIRGERAAMLSTR